MSNFKDWPWLTFFSAFFAFVLVLVAVINVLINQTTVAFIAIYIAYVFATLWVSTIWAEKRKRWIFAIFFLLYVVTAIFFFWVGTRIDVIKGGNWPPDLITYYDFEADAGSEGWGQHIERSDEHSFSGQYALKATLPVQADQETKFSLTWQQDFTADVIIGQIYWPATDDVSIVWAQVCVPLENWDCAGLLNNKGGWDTFVLDLCEMSVGDPPKPLCDLKLPGLHFQGILQGTTDTQVTTIPIYIDTIQIYRDGMK